MYTKELIRSGETFVEEQKPLNGHANREVIIQEETINRIDNVFNVTFVRNQQISVGSRLYVPYYGRYVRGAFIPGEPDITGIAKGYSRWDGKDFYFSKPELVATPAGGTEFHEDFRVHEDKDGTTVGLTVARKEQRIINGNIEKVVIPYAGIVHVNGHEDFSFPLDPLVFDYEAKNIDPIKNMGEQGEFKHTFLARPEKIPGDPSKNNTHLVQVLGVDHNNALHVLSTMDFSDCGKEFSEKIGLTGDLYWISDTEAFTVIHGMELDGTHNYQLGGAMIRKLDPYTLKVEAISRPFLNPRDEKYKSFLQRTPLIRSVAYAGLFWVGEGGVKIPTNFGDSVTSVESRTWQEVSTAFNDRGYGINTDRFRQMAHTAGALYLP